MKTTVIFMKTPRYVSNNRLIPDVELVFNCNGISKGSSMPPGGILPALDNSLFLWAICSG